MNQDRIARRAQQLAQGLRLEQPDIAIGALLSAVLPVLTRAGKPAEAFWAAMNAAQGIFYRAHPLPTYDRPKVDDAAQRVADLIATMDHNLHPAVYAHAIARTLTAMGSHGNTLAWAVIRDLGLLVDPVMPPEIEAREKAAKVLDCVNTITENPCEALTILVVATAFATTVQADRDAARRLVHEQLDRTFDLFTRTLGDRK